MRNASRQESTTQYREVPVWALFRATQTDVTAVWGKKKHKAHTTHRMYCMSVRAIRNLKQDTPIGMRVDVLDRGTRIRCTGSSFALVGDFANDAAKTGEAGTACSARC